MEEKNPVVPENPETAPVNLGDIERCFQDLSARITRQMEEAAQAESDRISQLDTREEALNKREMQSLARAEMEKCGLPADLASCLNFVDEAAVKEGVSLLEGAFRAAVQKGVEDRLLNHAAPKAAPILPLSELSDEEYYAAISRQNM